VINYKDYAMQEHSGVLDLERGQLGDIRPLYWQTDTSVSNKSWGYIKDDTFKSPEFVVHQLIDIVSKNGNLLNIGPRSDGTIPDEVQQVLLDVGAWSNVNGEAIYGTRPWSIAEGKTLDGTPVRFTAKNGTLFAIVLSEATPGSRGIAGLRLSERATVHLLGNDEPLVWTGTESGFAYTLPESLPECVAYSLKIAPSPDRD